MACRQVNIGKNISVLPNFRVFLTLSTISKIRFKADKMRRDQIKSDKIRSADNTK